MTKAVAAAANAGTLLAAAHALSPDAFGVFGAATAAILLFGRIMIFGCEHAFLRLRVLSPYSRGDGALLGAVLLVPTLIAAWAVLGAAGALWLVEPQHRPTVSATLAAAIGWTAVELAYWIFLAHGRLGLAVAAQAGTSVARFALIAALALTQPRIDTLLWVWSLGTLVPGGIALGLAARSARWPSGETVLALIRYARWQGLAQVLSALGGQLALLMLLIVGDQPAEAGKFSLALTLTFGVFFIYAGLFEHLSAHADGRAPSTSSRFLAASVRPTGAMAVLATLLLLAVYLLAPAVLPDALWDGGSTFVPLALATLLILVHAPLEAFLHDRLAPNAILASRLIRIGIVATIGLPIAIGGTAEEMALLQVASALASLIFLWARSRSV